jgi:hypothetical protein
LKYFRSPVQMTDLIILGSILSIYFLPSLFTIKLPSLFL